MNIIICASSICSVDSDFEPTYTIKGDDFCASCYENGCEELEARGWQYDRLILEGNTGGKENDT